MFRRVLVANRGEIARRIIRTLNKMGIESVAVFSEADQYAPYLREATHSICIGPAQAKASYLCEKAILQAALQSDSEAIHPGFGFLAENAIFAKRCNTQKLTFIGPSPHLISIMGDKSRAKSTMVSLGVPVLFGSNDIIKNSDEAKLLAEQSGYPVLLKARAGGGGKGMRLVKNASEMDEAFSNASRESQSAFGDGELYLEKYIKNARHIEFQVLGDNFGEVLVLGERECSIQRKNQKLIEEAPANRFSDDLRQEISEIIRTALKKIGYTNAGTMEFLVDHENKYYFMEMNTRIQVEHPVTELITGIDIVEWQLRIACNERLTFCQDEVKLNGVAIECRINAEDPDRNFLPNPGRITELILPDNNYAGPLRIDTHIVKDYMVGPFYDSMLAKVIAYAHTRVEAINLMSQALEAIKISGLATTLDFHKSVMKNQDFCSGEYDCSFLEKNYPKLLS